MSDPSESRPWAEFFGFIGWVVVIWAALGLLGLWPTRRLAGDPAVVAMLLALAVAAIGSVVGALPVLLARLQGRAQPHIVLVSMLVRLLVVMLLAAVILLTAGVEMTPFLLWLAGGYLALLVVDTRYALRLSDSL